MQIYQGLYYKGDIKAKCEEEYKQYQEACAQDGLEPKIMLVFVNELCAKLLEDETEEVKAEVDALVKRQENGEELNLRDLDITDGQLADDDLSPEMVERRKTLLWWDGYVNLIEANRI